MRQHTAGCASRSRGRRAGGGAAAAPARPTSDSSSSAPPSCSASRAWRTRRPQGPSLAVRPCSAVAGARRSARQAGSAIISGSNASHDGAQARQRGRRHRIGERQLGRQAQPVGDGRARPTTRAAAPRRRRAASGSRASSAHSCSRCAPCGAEAAPQRRLALALQHVRGLQVHRVEGREHQQQRAGGAHRAEQRASAASLAGPSKGTSAQRDAAEERGLAAGRARPAAALAYFGLVTNASRIQPPTWSIVVPGRRRANTRPVIRKIASRSSALHRVGGRVEARHRHARGRPADWRRTAGCADRCRA